MRWIYLGLFLCYYEALCLGTLHLHQRRKREVDLRQDDWPDDRPDASEIEKIVREHKENRQLLASLPSRYYEIVYPVQLRHQQKLGISTRDVGANKTGKHYQHTSLLIKAFNYKFRLDLELNTFLLAPNLIQKHFLPGDIQHIISQEIEHCYYHGTIKDYPGAFAALRTCNGVSGIIHVGNETFAVHPFYGGDLSKKHPHVIYEVKTRMKQACGNTRNLEWGSVHYRKHQDEKRRYKRDVREVTKYVELALVLDKSMFDKRNMSNRLEIIHDAVQIVNIVDLYFTALNTRVSIVYLETWAGGDQIVVSSDVRSSLISFMEYSSRKLYKVAKDSAQLLTGQELRGGEAGMSVPDSICTAKSVGVSKDVNMYEPHLAAITMAHAIGHNMGMEHDDSKCQCPDWHGCIMAESIVGQEVVQPYRFSSCSNKNYVASLRIGHGICLFNKPNQIEDFRTCGNGVVDDGEDCDCGSMLECPTKDPCCDPITCKLTAEAECSTGPCCDKCKLQPPGNLCRAPETECDIPEFCDGTMGKCPSDIYKRNGNSCNEGKGYCFHGKCPSKNGQCDFIWGLGGVAADEMCFKQFNKQGSFNGNCGVDINGVHRKCETNNVMCGSLQCKGGSRIPIVQGLAQKFTRTIISIGGEEFECKVTSGTLGSTTDMGLVEDGTKCGDDKICVNQTCMNVRLYIQGGHCPSNNVALDCSGHGVCSNVNTCFCEPGWKGIDCSLRSNYTGPVATAANPTQAATGQVSPSEPIPGVSTTPAEMSPVKIDDLEQKTTNIMSYEAASRGGDTIHMVIGLVSVVGGVFIVFAGVAVCYRRRSALPRYDLPYVSKKPIVRKIPVKVGNKDKDQEETSIENVNRIITFGSMPSYRYRPEDKMQEMKRQRFGKRDGKAGDDEDDVEVEDETVSFIELPPNNLSKLPEKGILKHGGGLIKADGHSDKWGDEISQSDNQEMLSGSDVGGGGGGGGLGSAIDQRGSGEVLTEVERTLKSMNGYHEDILEALRNAASHRGGGQCGTTGNVTVDDLRQSLCSSDGMSGDFGLAAGILKGSRDKLNDSGENMDDDDMSMVPPCGPIRIRNLEDLIRQLERHPNRLESRHMSPIGSEDIRFSETEADRHYRLERQQQQLQQQQQQQQQQLQQDIVAPPLPDTSRFVYGRFRHPTSDVDVQSSSSSRGYSTTSRQRTGPIVTIDQEELDDNEDGDEDDDDDVENGEFVCKHLVRSASEEAMAAAVKREHSFERNLNSGHHDKSTLKSTCTGHQTFDYFPSPPSEDSYPDSYEENASFPAVPSESSGSRSGSNDLVFQDRQRASAGATSAATSSADQQRRVNRSTTLSTSSGDQSTSKGKGRQLPKSQSPFFRRENDHYYS